MGDFFRGLRRVVVGAMALMFGSSAVYLMILHDDIVWLAITLGGLLVCAWIVGFAVEQAVSEWRWERDFRRRKDTPPTGYPPA